MDDTTAPATAGRYGEDLFSPVYSDESQRLIALAAACDPATTSTLAELRIAPGADCLEIGAGTGSLSVWIAENRAPRRVVATDLDTKAMLDLRHPALEILRHDVRVDSFPPSSFDLIVARNLLCHLPQREQILARIIGWLRPGGHLFVEDTSFFPAESSPDPTLRTLARAAATLMADSIGSDVQNWARSYPRPLMRHALTDIGLRIDCPVLTATNPAGRAWRLSIEALTTKIHQTGIVDPALLIEAMTHLGDPAFTDSAHAMIAAWGQRPLTSMSLL